MLFRKIADEEEYGVGRPETADETATLVEVFEGEADVLFVSVNNELGRAIPLRD